MTIRSVNPFTGETNGEFELMGAEQVGKTIRKAEQAFTMWRLVPISEREKYIRSAAGVLRQNMRRYAEIITREMGKPIKQSTAEVEKCAWLCDYYSESSHQPLEDDIIRTESAKSYVAFEPLGLILGIMPWNFPFWQVFRFAIPALAEGNVCLLKHASNVPITALAIEKLFEEAEFPAGVFQTMLIDASTAGSLIEEDKVDGVSLTGSVSAGSHVGSLAGRRIKKLVLELGGSDPFIVLEDADMDKAAQTGVLARHFNGGQSCIAAKRFIVMKSVAEEFQERFLGYFKAMKIGDPMDEATDIGPLARREFIEPLEEQLEDARRKGANIFYGPKPPDGGGFFFRPAVATGVKPDMKIMTEEVFGPIAPIVTAENEDEVIRIANATEFGLGASIWSRDTERAERLAMSIESGFVAINDMVKSDPRLPFGGIKRSGVGRELSSYGLREFVNAKTIVVK
jgi:succinate-semialdehyde dehydrogenase/glutarate-semialdehyde dehydrogenase